MKAMILAAGFGKRLRPLTLELPKPLVPANGKALIEYPIARLKAADVTDIVINLGYLGHKIQAYLGDGQRFGVNIQYSVESETDPLETAGGIKQALPLLGDAPFIVVNADVWTDIAFEPLINKPLDDDTLGHLVLIPNPDFKQGQGDFALASDQKGSPSSRLILGKDYTFSGVSLLKPELLNSVPKQLPMALRPVLEQAIAKRQLSANVYQGPWFDVGTIERLEQLNRFLQPS
ncbi:MAG: nucleotidyltransferase family protein [Pseudomonadota bacterium]|nr:nucleotidyltransferase family protein [Pseudomonadota bacterium]